jgi:hypothetical protein
MFSNEVCSTFTAMSSQTLLSDHVCAAAFSIDILLFVVSQIIYLFI